MKPPKNDQQKQAQDELQELNQALEEKVRERTRDLQESWHLLETVLNNIGEGMIVLDQQGKFRLVNEYFFELFDLGERDLLWETWPEFLQVYLPDRQTPFPWEDFPLTLAMAGQSSSNVEMYIKSKESGPGVYLSVSGRPLIDKQGHLTGGVIMLRDISEQRQLQEQFLQAQKMEAIGRLAGGVAHDFNNLLTIISGYSDLIASLAPPPDPVRLDRYIREIQQAACRAGTLTSQLLAFSRKQVIQPQVLDINKCLADLRGMLERLIGEDIDFQVETAPGLAPIYADPSQIEQIIMNLVVNARDAMPQGGKLLLRTSNRCFDTTECTPWGPIYPGDYVCLEISDTGQGISDSIMPYIFEPFFTTKEIGKGTGLGLATVYGIVRQYEGYVNVWSWPDQGTTILICFPQGKDKTAPANAPSSPRPKAYRGHDTILVVEDDDDLRELVCLVLRDHGFRVLEAKSPQLALDLIDQDREQVTLLLTDVVMPGLSGRELSERLLAVQPLVRVLYMSGYTDDAIMRYGLMQQHINLLPKPFLPDQLILKIQEVLED